MVGRPRSYASVWQQRTFFRAGRERAPFLARIKIAGVGTAARGINDAGAGTAARGINDAGVIVGFTGAGTGFLGLAASDCSSRPVAMLREPFSPARASTSAHRTRTITRTSPSPKPGRRRHDQRRKAGVG
jgi:hypothetical protein